MEHERRHKMSYSIYQVSKEQTVVSFTQNQREPNKVGEAMKEAMYQLVIDGVTYPEAYKALKTMHDDFKAKKTRGIDSVTLSCQIPHDQSVQVHKCIFLSYKLNGTFATFTEYLPYNK